MKKTPLYDRHVALGGNMIDFGGWMMPVQYSGILNEHERVRNAAGLFDVSHMGEITVRGSGATEYLQKLLTNDIAKAAPGRAVYSPMCYPDGGVVDDLLVYRISEQSYLVVVNASNTERDYKWFREHLIPGAEIENVSEQYAQIAIQGPAAEAILQQFTVDPLGGIGFYRFKNDVRVDSIPSIVSRTGYTGEDGFEVYLSADQAPRLWDDLLEAGAEKGLVPAGLGARDTLRFEAALPLYGHELSETISPLEAGLGKFVKPAKEDFIGRQALLRQLESGAGRRLAGLQMTGRGVARSGCEVRANGRPVGHVTTGNYSPSLKKNLGIILVDANTDLSGLSVVIRGKEIAASAVPIPFYQKRYKK